MRLIILLACLCTLSATAQTRDELLNELGVLYNAQQYKEALPIARKILEKTKQELGADHIQYARSLNDLASIYFGLEEFKLALPLAMEAATIRRNKLGETAPLYIETLQGVALTYTGLEDYGNAISYYKKAGSAWKKAKGEFSPEYAGSLQSIAAAFADLNEYDSANYYYKACARITKAFAGYSSWEHARSLYDEAYLHYIFGEFRKSAELAIESASIRKTVLGPASSDYATSLSLSGLSYLALGEYDKTEPLLLESLGIERSSGDENNYSTAMSNLGMFYHAIGNYNKAAQLLTEVIGIKLRTVGKEHADYLTAAGNLSVIYTEMQEFDKAALLMKEVAAIRKKNLSEQHPDYALSIQNLAGIYIYQDKYEEAISLLQEASALRKQTFGTDHPEYANCLNSLAAAYFEVKRYAEAETLLQNILELRRKNPGPQHPDFAASLNNLALFYSTTGKREKAAQFMMESNSITRKHLISTFVLLSAQEKSEFIDNRITTLDDNNSLLYNHQKEGDPFIRHSFDQLVFFKSLLLMDSRNMVKMVQASTDKELKNIFEEWRQLQKKIAEEIALPMEQRSGALKKMETKAEALEKQLMLRSAAFRSQQASLTNNFTTIRKSLAPDEAVVEFVRFDLFNQHWTDSTMYAAYIVRPQDTVPVFVPLFEEKQLQHLLDSAGRNAPRMAAQLYQTTQTGKLVPGKLSKSLYQLAWAPLEKHLNGVKRIRYSPAGDLYKIAFHAIPIDSVQLLMDRYQLNQQNGAGESLTNTGVETGKRNSGIVLFGDPDFAMDSLQLVQQQNKYKEAIIASGVATLLPRGERGAGWSPLPGTANEVMLISDLFTQKNLPSTLYTKAIASEFSLKALSGKAPGILHMATHGFFIPSPSDHKRSPGMMAMNTYRLAEDPLLRTGLVLSGGNYAWSGKTPIAGVEDGILTAYEIAQLDLTGTELVVLSACETALGDIKGAEGVFGLQRAFKMAGAQQLIVSLWSVPDKETAELMTRFYTYRINGKTIADAFSAARADLREKYPAYFWAAFVLVQ